MERQTLTVQETADLFGISCQAVRERCKLGIIPSIVIDKKKAGKKSNQYIIPKAKVYNMLGIVGE